jgi:hypothetical protein
MSANYQICRRYLSRLSFDERLIFDAYGRQHRDPDDIAAAIGLSSLRVDIRGNNRTGTNRPELRRLRDEILAAFAAEGRLS